MFVLETLCCIFTSIYYIHSHYVADSIHVYSKHSCWVTRRFTVTQFSHSVCWEIKPYKIVYWRMTGYHLEIKIKECCLWPRQVDQSHCWITISKICLRAPVYICSTVYSSHQLVTVHDMTIKSRQCQWRKITPSMVYMYCMSMQSVKEIILNNLKSYNKRRKYQGGWL